MTSPASPPGGLFVPDLAATEAGIAADRGARRGRRRPRGWRAVALALVALVAVVLIGAKLYIELVWKHDPPPPPSLDPIGTVAP